jgi:dolichol-phosphate mannosyltransferase
VRLAVQLGVCGVCRRWRVAFGLDQLAALFGCGACVDGVILSGSTLGIVLAAKNEADSIGAVLREVNEARVVLERSAITVDVIVVDDSHDDATRIEAERVGELLGLQLHVFRGPAQGLGAGVLAGLQLALERGADLIANLDADGQHNAQQLPTLVWAMFSRHADIVIGSRWTRGGRSPGTNFSRTVLSRTANFFLRRACSISGVRDATTSFRVYSPAAVRLLLEVPVPTSGYGFFSAAIAASLGAGLRVSEVPIEFRPRYEGASNLTPRELWKFAAAVPAIRSMGRVARVYQEASSESATSHHVEYQWVEELLAFSKATRFNRWIAESLMLPEHGDALEVGGGLGSMRIACEAARPGLKITTIEPSTSPFDQLSTRVNERVLREDTAVHLEREVRYNAIVHVNVLEHIKDDGGELARCRQLLQPGGTIHLFLPASQAIFGSYDEKAGHFRRYSRSEIRIKLTEAGFTVESMRAFDLLGWFSYLIIGSGDAAPINDRRVQLYERIWVPTSRFVDDRIFGGRPRFGKNLVVIARS